MTNREFQVPQHIHRWLLNEIVEGMQKMVLLKLTDHPALETIAVVAVTFCDVLQAKYMTWDKEQDTPRVRAAFNNIMLEESRWPTPAVFFEHLPERPAPKELPSPPMTHEESVEFLKFLKEKKQELQIKTIDRMSREYERRSFKEMEPDPAILAKQEHIRNLAQAAGWGRDVQS